MQRLTVICTRGQIKGSVVAIAAVVATIAVQTPVPARTPVTERPVSVERFHIQLVSTMAPLTERQEGRVIAKITADRPGQPSVSGGHVEIAMAAAGAPLVARRALWPFALLSLAFTVAAIVVLQQPMGMRHGPEPEAAHATVNAPPAFRGEALSPAHHHH